MRASTLPLALLGTLALAGCGGSSDAGGAATTLSVQAGDRGCTTSAATAPAGRTSIEVRNTGSDVTEVYVYGKGSGGAFDKVVGEVENVAPGTGRSFTADLAGGAYEIACKPGQKGDGIRTPLTVTGGSAPAAAATGRAYDREVEVTATEYRLAGLAGFTGRAGEKVEFVLRNEGTIEHELEILGPDGAKLGEVGPTAAGSDGEVILTLTAPGTYTYLCGIADHADRGMKGTFTVT